MGPSSRNAHFHLQRVMFGPPGRMAPTPGAGSKVQPVRVLEGFPRSTIDATSADCLLQQSNIEEAGEGLVDASWSFKKNTI
ncbi:uncharacterized protein PHALS_14841 [Plasmopara halstedii]|uniref:Uncharacterized protein n=1 Tax=Plasmopara halstedii TaxID=4781 RepID=A0A0P1AUF8_PLAHL|nr:uncharacterized protein PHALS_14841 [Plasmopara halstedii]CEG45782.1 hypothetical protein PHALS_14841 [Plasmopara halstedii]|eukprot:XP_024582151.1 hypothetical protein PHALS_14841 [Plasmopara halstedii]